ncbi:MAG: hypothetical protein J3Q66DRAFT_437500 [Benniella sp.]|nr:MAG: hypothetical protein J3Q66DRAFT_437500 [Benniella sp.]
MKQAASTVFSIPLILDLVTLHLAPMDLSQCVLVCRAFWSAFVPYLWKDVRFSNLTRQEGSDFAPSLLSESEGMAGERRLYYCYSVTSIQVVGFLPLWLTLSTAPVFPRLRRFRLLSQDWDDIGAPTTMSQALDILEANTTLREIDLSYLNVGQDFMPRFQRTMDHLPVLTQLVLNIRGRLPLLHHLYLLEACQRLEKLHFSIDTSSYEYRALDQQELEMYQDQMSRIKAEMNNIKDLLLNTDFFGLIMPGYLQRSPRLERLIIPKLSTANARIDLSETIRVNCPGLKHLEIRSAQMWMTSQTEVISACSPSGDPGDIRPGLESLTIRLGRGLFPSIVIDAILDHKGTLTSLSIVQNSPLPASTLQRIVKVCAHLRTLMIRVIFSNAIGIQMNVIQNEQWSCHCLQTFSILFEDRCTEPGRESAMGFLQYMYAQLGTIKTLEVLSFQMGLAGWVPLRHMFLNGLEHLFNLRRLRVFGLHKEEASMLDKRLVQTMLDRWPRLEQLGGLLESPRTKRLSEWVMKKRPDLDLTTLDHEL